MEEGSVEDLILEERVRPQAPIIDGQELVDLCDVQEQELHRLKE